MRNSPTMEPRTWRSWHSKAWLRVLLTLLVALCTAIGSPVFAANGGAAQCGPQKVQSTKKPRAAAEVVAQADRPRDAAGPSARPGTPTGR